MNSVEAKKLNLPEIMSRLGHEPIRIKNNGNEYWYNSPFRVEKDASFHTSFLGGKWIWNDFGDSGGTVIDFILKHENFGDDIPRALKYLDGLYGKVGAIIKSKPSFSFQQQPSKILENNNDKELEFISANKIQNPIILKYLTEERHINKDLTHKYLEEVRYKNLTTQKEYFAFGMKNESGGYEIRVASDKYKFKSSLIEKDITLIKGFKTNRVVNIFEGMTDFVSLLTMMKTDNLYGDSILMHSVKSYERTLSMIQKVGYNSVNTFLDNDKSGREYTAKFKSDLGDLVSNQSEQFLPFVDINEMLKSQSKGISRNNPFTR